MASHLSVLMLWAPLAVSALLNEAAARVPTHELDVVLHPVVDAKAEVSAIEVSERVDGELPVDGSPLSLSVPVTYAAVTHVADRITALVVNDVDGSVPLLTGDDKPAAGGFPYYRHWIAQRAVRFPVSITYTALVQPTGSPNGPAFGIRPSGGGVSGSGGGFLLLPSNAGTTMSRVRWDLGALPQGSVGVTTFGEGEFNVPGSAERLNEEWMMAGPVHRFSAPGGKDNFSAFWLGTAPFDAEKEMSWVASAYSELAKSFRYLNPAPNYRVFMRVLDAPPYGGGTALANSFMLSMSTAGSHGSIADRRETFFHEMTHQWVGDIEAAEGVKAWFVEGLTVYYTTVLPLRGGLIPIDEYAERVNRQAREYYESPARNWSAAKIAEIGFGDERTRHTPYMRGALYFADLDRQIRQRSHGRRDLDAFLCPMFVSRQRGVRFDVTAWESMLGKELGPRAVAEFRAELLDGTKTVVPADGAFGPCFSRVREKPPGDSNDDNPPIYQWARVTLVPDALCRAW